MLLFLILKAAPAHGQAAFEPWIATGEVGLVNGTVFWQGGAAFTYEWPWLAPFVEVGVTPAPLGWGIEGMAGVGFGHAIRWLKPSLSFSTGYQSMNHRTMTGDRVIVEGEVLPENSDGLVRHSTRVHRFALRIDLFNRVWGDLQGNLNTQSKALPLWRLRIGYHWDFPKSVSKL